MEPLTISQTHTGYWVVQSGAVELAGAITLKGAEAERDLMRRLRDRAQEAAQEREPVRSPA
jgi:hypothetical protein